MKNITLSNAFNDYLKRAGLSPSSKKTADALNQYLPRKLQLTRQGIHNWIKNDKAEWGVFYALARYAPATTNEKQLAEAVIELVEAEPVEKS